MSFAGKLVMMEEKRGRGVGFQSNLALYNHNKNYTKDFSTRFNSIDASSEKNNNKN